MKREVIFNELKALMVRMFELDPDDVTPDARLYQDLDLDSIDAVDMMVHLKKSTGRDIKPEVFKEVKTVGDIVTVLEGLLKDVDDVRIN